MTLATVVDTSYDAIARFLKHHGRKLIGILVGVACLCLSDSNYSSYMEKAAHRPADLRASIWFMPQATLEKVLSFSPGQPTAVVLLQDFRQEIGNGPYQVYIWKGWKENHAPKLAEAWVIKYHAEVVKGGTRTYLVAYENAPSRVDEDWGWKFVTRFDGAQNTFISEATKLSVGYWFWGWAWWYVGLMVFAAVILRIVWQLLFVRRPTA
ncbi:MAG TPA: hypothetical protein VGP13_02625 [Candidatus Paceibacterota bacterium]|jgi:hypothetical protein|nr:hypothetical protein [Candidatus Paceibacterota bacterium]